MTEPQTVGEMLARKGISRRALLRYAAWVTSIMALPSSMTRAMAQGIADTKRMSVIWLSCQECTACTESLTRSYSPTIDDLIFDFISLDYHEALQAAAGHQAEEARLKAMEDNKDNYVVIVDGSIPLGNMGYSTVAGHANADVLRETAEHALAVVAVGSCATWGGLPKADPNPTGAVSVSQIVRNTPIINISGCPPIPEAMTGTLAHVLAFGQIPELDHLGRPRAFFGNSIHDRCYRRPFYDKGLFAKSFDDEGARKGWCLYELGCKGPVTYNACATLKWNGGASWPVQTGHGCLGCSEPDFWDRGSFYKPLPASTEPLATPLAAGAVAGVAAGALASRAAKTRREILGAMSKPKDAADTTDKT
ncbi:MAG: hydrogenase small subunit [Rhodobacteraceae bacterium]|nr:hydrogenase small subunit [Alphaproteobacteria bacterium]MBT8477173.1 hydrogenase small subunit [Alphaproteobacteria bacterium]NNF70840.1 hydrogenase small subunit [Paracoccaceae bacterium]NNK67433.1 hydrogenase small subunit [Paracoccaceae bacterium]